MGVIEKEITKTSMLVNYFTEDGLIKNTGISKEYWDFVIFKELVDNALDAIEPVADKNVYINIDTKDRRLQIFDNGKGISIETINEIYDFSYFVSKNRDRITPSRGKQGNGLKTIISICYLMGYRLLWHTSEGFIIENIIDDTEIQDGKVLFQTIQHGNSVWKGIEIVGYKNVNNPVREKNIQKFFRCNQDVNFYYTYDNIPNVLNAKLDAVNRSGNTSISFYDIKAFKDYILKTQDGNITYKKFLKMFGSRISDASSIKGKIKDIDFNSNEFVEDFIKLKSLQNSKKYTILKSHMIGLKYSLNTEILMQRDKNTNEVKTYVPCIIEFDAEKVDLKNDKRYYAECTCFINNTISYDDSWSIVFDEGFYDLGMRTCHSSKNLAGLLENYNDYRFAFHFISPYFIFKDAGKTEIDITSIITDLAKELRKALVKEKKRYDSSIEKPIQNTDLLRPYMDDAFSLASTNGKYAITARQMWYKIREISGAPDEAYTAFTQTVLTEWINNHPEYEDKINFANRGVFYIGDKQDGLGTANVRNFINNIGKAPNTFNCYGGVSDNVYIDDNFNVEYKYDKVLYIEKTGFDDIFKAEKIGEKYHMIIVSGQGFATRAAKTILYALQNKGLKLYCMHDLDISGVNIFKSFQTTNDKFEHPIDIEDLGITIEDVYRYNIQPEQVEKGKSDRDKLLSMSDEYRSFFDGVTHYNRVELNAFTTEQILEIMDRKLSIVNNLPKINLTNTFEVDHEALRNVAFMRVMSRRYKDKLSDIYVPCDLSLYEGRCTVDVAKKAIPEIKDELILQYEHEIEKKLNIF